MIGSPCHTLCHTQARKGDYISKVAQIFNVELEDLLLDNQRVILDLDEPIEGRRLRLCNVPASKYNYLQAPSPALASVHYCPCWVVAGSWYCELEVKVAVLTCVACFSLRIC